MLDDKSFTVRNQGGIEWLASHSLADKASCLRHYFLTRRGGVSEGAFADLNLGFGRGDKDGNVRENRGRVARNLELPMEPLFLRQVHADKIIVVREGDTQALLSAPPEADAYITALRGVPLMILTADCIPVIICDVRTPALGVIHAGWRGTALSIVWKTVITMMDVYGTRPEDCMAAIGPGIGPKCYEVGEEVHDSFAAAFSYSDLLFSPAGERRGNVDLREANRLQLMDALLKPASVDVCGECTHCESARFFSARRDGIDSGRQGAVAMLV